MPTMSMETGEVLLATLAEEHGLPPAVIDGIRSELRAARLPEFATDLERSLLLQNEELNELLLAFLAVGVPG
jgi:hypothetical protein